MRGKYLTYQQAFDEAMRLWGQKPATVVEIRRMQDQFISWYKLVEVQPR